MRDDLGRHRVNHDCPVVVEDEDDSLLAYATRLERPGSGGKPRAGGCGLFTGSPHRALLLTALPGATPLERVTGSVAVLLPILGDPLLRSG